MVNLSNLPLRPQAPPGRGERTLEKTPPVEVPGETLEARLPKGLAARPQNSQNHSRSCFCPTLCPLGSSDWIPLWPWQDRTARLTGTPVCWVEMICVPVTLALSATAERAGGGGPKAKARNTLWWQGPSSPGQLRGARPTWAWLLPPQKQCVCIILECR